MDSAVGVLHPQLQRAVRVGGLGRRRAGGGVDLVRLAARHLGRLQAVDRLDLRVRVDDPPTGVLQEHTHRRVAEDRVHHPALAIESVDELELAEEHGGLAGQHPGEPASLRSASGHPGHQQSGQPALDLDRDGKCVLRRAEQVEQRAKAPAARRGAERTKQLGAVGDGHPW